MDDRYTPDQWDEAARFFGFHAMPDPASLLPQQTEAIGRAVRLIARIDRAEDALRWIAQWSDAYPLDIFPEPVWERVEAVLAAGGMTLDAISASCMRHVVEGVGKIAREALQEP